MKKIIIVALLLIVFVAQSAFADDLQEFGSKMCFFYSAPSAEAFYAFQQKAERLRGRLESTGNRADVLTAVMIARISEKNGWPIADGGIGGLAKEIVKGESRLAKYVADDAQVDPGKLDVWWASFFATGDEKYLEKVFNYAGLELPSGDTKRMLLIGAATWSFKANCSQHQKILAFAKRKIDDAGMLESQRKFAKECIDDAVTKTAKP